MVLSDFCEFISVSAMFETSKLEFSFLKFYYTCEQTTSHLSQGVSKVHSHFVKVMPVILFAACLLCKHYENTKCYVITDDAKAKCKSQPLSPMVWKGEELRTSRAALHHTTRGEVKRILVGLRSVMSLCWANTSAFFPQFNLCLIVFNWLEWNQL